MGLTERRGYRSFCILGTIARPVLDSTADDLMLTGKESVRISTISVLASSGAVPSMVDVGGVILVIDAMRTESCWLRLEPRWLPRNF